VPFCQASVLAIRQGLKLQSRRVAKRVRVRIRRMLTSDLPGIGLPIRIAKPGLYKATVGNGGAVVAMTSTGPLGLRPGEFDFVCPWIPDGVTHLADHGDGKKTWTVVPPPGTQIRVLEKWRTYERESDGVDGFLFEADGAFVRIENTAAAADLWVDAHKNGIHRDKWRSPWFMPRWAARTQLTILGARLERLHEITDEDARIEGVVAGRIPADEDGPERIGYVFGRDDGRCTLYPTVGEAFVAGWDALNGKRAPWASNPWVWAYTFSKKGS
jgi:hypothetical protein